MNRNRKIAHFCSMRSPYPMNSLMMFVQDVDAETIVIGNRDDANQPDVFDLVRQAEVVFCAGGDQCNYTWNFYHTGEETVKSVVARGVGVSGTSAGQ